MDTPSPFHVGEQRVQARLGVREIEAWAQKAVRAYLPEQHRAFHTTLPFLVASARDALGRPWATLLVGREGFVTSPDPTSLVIDAGAAPGDALDGALVPGCDLGLLGIELSTRRRNRVNGRIVAAGPSGLAFAVGQTFGNCPQHIRERAWRRVASERATPARRDSLLSPSQRLWIARVDTFFIASGYRGDGESRTFGMDAAHRGGDPGFVRVESDTRLAFPDYAGNNHYNTIGNLVLDPRAGLLFVDFATGSLLQLTGRMTVNWDPTAADSATDWALGAQRVLTFDIEEVVELQRAIPLRWATEAEPALALRVAYKIRESDDVVSFILESKDGEPLPAFAPGQHLPITIGGPDGGADVDRTYSLSGPASSDFYRIGVKREAHGIASRRLHDTVEVGSVLRAQPPRGDFMLEEGESPVVLVSAGVGSTPMLAMLHALARQVRRRPVWFLHGARDAAHHPFAREVRELARKHGNVVVHTAYSRPPPRDAGPDTGHDTPGRIDGDVIDRLDPPRNAHYYLCGPTAFMASVQGALERRGVPAERIHSETFGPRGGAQ